MVERFYDAVRSDALLGPIFEKHVVDWTPHLARMKDFWASIALESGRFRGNPMMKHIAVGNHGSVHFDRWLVLWNQTLDAFAPSDSAATIFRDAADRIASSLLIGINVQRGGLDTLSNTQEKRPC